MLNRIISMITIVMMSVSLIFTPVPTFASSSEVIKYTDGIVGGAIYFDPSTGTVIGCDSTVTEAVIPAQIAGTNVIRIGDEAFAEMGVQYIKLPDSVISIGAGAFRGAEKVILGSNVKDLIFYNSLHEWSSPTNSGYLFSVFCSDKSNICNDFDKKCYISSNHPQSTTGLPDKMLYPSLTGIKQIEISEDNLFYSVENGILYNKDKTELIMTLSSANTMETIEIPNSVKIIKSFSFSSFFNVDADIVIPDSVEEIETCAFANIRANSITISKGVKEIMPYTFSGSIKTVELKDGVEKILKNAFAGFAYEFEIDKDKIIIPSTVEVIENGAFGSSYISSIQLDETNPYWKYNGFLLTDKEGTKAIKYARNYFFQNTYSFPEGITSVGSYVMVYEQPDKIVLPESIKRLEDHAFDGFMYHDLKEINLPENLEYIGEYAFRLADLENITIPGKVTTISENAFTSCALSSVDISEGVKCIGERAFSFCTNLKNIVIPPSVTSIADNAFYWCDDSLTIYGVRGSYAETYAKEHNIAFSANTYINGSIEVEYKPSKGKKNKSISLDYRDEYFTRDNTIYDLDLAKLSLGAAMASMTAVKDKNGNEIPQQESDVNLENMLTKQLSFNEYQSFNYDIDLKDKSDKVAFSIANKKVIINGELETILAVIIRSGGYGGEWASNGRVEGGYDSSLHNGFSSAALKATEQAKAYMTQNNLDPETTKVWISGFSRGAAVSNLIGKYMSEANLVQPENLYCYTCATPKTTQKQENVRGIFNTINPIDLVTEVPLKDWNYGYYGKSYYLPSKVNKTYSTDLQKTKENFNIITGETYEPYINHRFFIQRILDAITNAVEITEENYYKYYQNDVSELLATTMGDAEGEPNILALLSYFSINLNSMEDVFYNGVVGAVGLIPIADMIANGSESQAMKQHWPEAYMAWLETGTIYNSQSKKAVKVKCPVDIIVYDENDVVVAKIIDNNALDFMEANPDIALDAYVDENGEKQIIIPTDGEYRVEIIAKDDGNMNYSVNEYGDNGELERKINYSDIEIKENDEFESNFAEGCENEVSSFNLVQNETQIISETEVITEENVENISISVESIGQGYTIGSGNYTSGDSVVLTAVPFENTVFCGWYENDELLSAESTYGFIAQPGYDRKITAKFVTTIIEENTILKQDTYSFTGKMITPSVSVSSNGQTLIEDRDYSVTYTDNINAGTGSVTVTGKGNYTGQVTKNFTIEKADMDVSANDYSGTYDGKPHSFSLNGVPEGVTVMYKISANGTYSNAKPSRIDAGTTTVYYKIEDKNYNTVTGSAEILIEPVDASVCTAKLNYTKFTYSGSEKTPVITVKDADGNLLEKDTDYTVSGATSRISVGRYKIVITYTGNYSGSKNLYYTIVPKAPANVDANLRTVSGGYDDIKVSWSKSTGASGYAVYMKKGKGEYVRKTYTNKTSYTIKNLSDGYKYTFKIVPYYKSSSGTKYLSTKYKTDYVYTLKKVTGVKTSKSGSKVKVKWTNISGETGYQISRSTSKTGTKIVATYKTTSGTYKTVSATKGKTYYYKVRAYKVVDGEKVYGPWSNVIKYKRI